MAEEIKISALPNLPDDFTDEVLIPVVHSGSTNKATRARLLRQGVFSTSENDNQDAHTLSQSEHAYIFDHNALSSNTLTLHDPARTPGKEVIVININTGSGNLHFGGIHIPFHNHTPFTGSIGRSESVRLLSTGTKWIVIPVIMG